jgi:hypothetical protein
MLQHVTVHYVQQVFLGTCLIIGAADYADSIYGATRLDTHNMVRVIVTHPHSHPYFISSKPHKKCFFNSGR